MPILCFKKKAKVAAGDDLSTPADAGYGKRDIGLIGAVALTANNICGSGMVVLPALFQQAGWVVPTMLFLLIAGWSAASSLFLSKTIASMPGNRTFRHRWEYGPIAEALLPRWAFLAVLGFLCLSFISQNISNIVATGQVMDSVLLAIAGKTCAISFSGDAVPNGHNATHATTGPILCVTAASDALLADSPFGSAYTISAGYAITALMTLPLSFFALDDSIGVQIGGILLVVGSIVIWAAQFIVLSQKAGSWVGPLAPLPLSQALPAFGSSSQAFAQILPTVLFNYGFVATIPSFLNEKAPTTSITKTVFISVVVSTLLFLAIGLFGAVGANWSSGIDILSLLADPRARDIWGVSKILIYIFPAANFGTSIPVFSVIVRYNLLQSGWNWLSKDGPMGLWPANLISIGVPWVLSIVFYPGDALASVINWSSALIFVAINLLFPVWLYYRKDAAFSLSSAPPMPAGIEAKHSGSDSALLNEEGLPLTKVVSPSAAVGSTLAAVASALDASEREAAAQEEVEAVAGAGGEIDEKRVPLVSKAASTAAINSGVVSGPVPISRGHSQIILHPLLCNEPTGDHIDGVTIGLDDDDEEPEPVEDISPLDPLLCCFARLSCLRKGRRRTAVVASEDAGTAALVSSSDATTEEGSSGNAIDERVEALASKYLLYAACVTAVAAIALQIVATVQNQAQSSGSEG